MKKKFIKRALTGFVVAVMAATMCLASGAYADDGFSMSPMKQSIVLDPGESYQSSITISNPGTNTSDFAYEVSISPFFVNEDYQSVFESNGSYSQIVDWITLDSPSTGVMAPNESREIFFTINVPSWAPAGGQYASIVVSSGDNPLSEGMTINEKVAIGHIIYAEITGETSKQGDFVEMSVPGFIFSGYIGGSSAIRNNGNTHGVATYTLQVYPLFSDEEIYSNAEEPYTHIIMPGRTYYDNDTVWPGTPAIGIFNVVYTVEYEGVTEQVSKMVIKCPVYLLFLILFVIALIIVWIVMKTKRRKSANKE